MRDAIPRFAGLRREFEAIGLAHRDVCLHAFEATRVDSAASLPRQLSGLRAFTEDLQAALARWKLAGTAGPSPILGPFAAALVRGVHAGRRWPSPSVPSLRIVPGVDGGDVVAVLAYGHRVEHGERSAGAAGASRLSPSPTGQGRRVDQPQLIDARLWTLRRIGGVTVRDLASWQGVGRHRIDRILGHMDRGLDNGLPHPRPNAAGHSTDRQ